MTEDEVRTALEAKGFNLRKPDLLQELGAGSLETSIDVGRFSYVVHLYFDWKTNRLREVVIRPLLEPPQEFGQQASDLKKVLSDKYGASQKLANGFQWRFTTTVIELTIQPTLTLFIRYYPNVDPKKDRDKL